MRIHHALHLAAALSLVLASAAFAQSGNTTGDVTGTAQAQTASGQVTVTSHRGTIDPNAYKIDFDAIDINHDGYISRAEANASGNYNLANEFRLALDINHDGRLSREELKNWK